MIQYAIQSTCIQILFENITMANFANSLMLLAIDNFICKFLLGLRSCFKQGLVVFMIYIGNQCIVIRIKLNIFFSHFTLSAPKSVSLTIHKHKKLPNKFLLGKALQQQSFCSEDEIYSEVSVNSCFFHQSGYMRSNWIIHESQTCTASPLAQIGRTNDKKGCSPNFQGK